MTEIDFLSSIFDGYVAVPTRSVGAELEAAFSATSSAGRYECSQAVVGTEVSLVGRAAPALGLMHAPRNV